MTRLPEITIAAISLATLFLYAGFNADTPSKTDYSSWQQYGGEPDHGLLADGNTAIIYFFMR